MPDQAPPAPKDCVYGPWYDGSRKKWFALCPYRGMRETYRIWLLTDDRGWEESSVCDVVGYELLSLAKELEQKASQPSEEDRAVLWLMKQRSWLISKENDMWVRSVRCPDSVYLLEINPIEEAKKLGWGG